MTLPHLTDKEAEAPNHLVNSTTKLNLRSSDFLSIATSTTPRYLTFEKYLENQRSSQKNKEENKKDLLTTVYNKSKYSYSTSYMQDIVLQCFTYNSLNPQNSCL